MGRIAGRPHARWEGQAASPLRRRRLALGLPLRALAEACGLSTGALSAMETRGSGSAQAWRAVAAALGVRPGEALPPHASDPQQPELWT